MTVCILRPLILALLTSSPAWAQIQPCYPSRPVVACEASGDPFGTLEPSSIIELRAINKSDLQRAYEACKRHLTNNFTTQYEIPECDRVEKMWLTSPERKAEIERDKAARTAQDAADRALIDRVAKTLK